MNSAKTPVNITDQSGTKYTLVSNPLMGNLLLAKLKPPFPAAITDPKNPLMLFFNDSTMKDLWIAITWGK